MWNFVVVSFVSGSTEWWADDIKGPTGLLWFGWHERGRAVAPRYCARLVRVGIWSSTRIAGPSSQTQLHRVTRQQPARQPILSQQFRIPQKSGRVDYNVSDPEWDTRKPFVTGYLVRPKLGQEKEIFTRIISISYMHYGMHPIYPLRIIPFCKVRNQAMKCLTD